MADILQENAFKYQSRACDDYISAKSNMEESPDIISYRALTSWVADKHDVSLDTIRRYIMDCKRTLRLIRSECRSIDCKGHFQHSSEEDTKQPDAIIKPVFQRLIIARDTTYHI